MNKTPSQRLRAVIFLLWEQSDKKVDAETYYAMVMEKIIEQFKERLE